MNWKGQLENNGQILEEVVGLKATISVSSVGNKVILRMNAKGDRSKEIILRLSRTQEERGKLVKAREKLAGARRGGSSPKNCKTWRRTGGSRMVIYKGDSEGEENPVSGSTHKPQSSGGEHLAMVLKKFDWTKCLAVAIPAKVNGKPVVAIVDTGIA